MRRALAASEACHNFRDYLLRILMFPVPQYSPSLTYQSIVSVVVALDVSSQFLLPPFPICSRHCAVIGAAMPITSVDENGYLPPREEDVCSPPEFRDRRPINEVPKPLLMKQAPDRDLGLRIATRLVLHSSQRGVRGSRRSHSLSMAAT
jgi:hypothetical protein